MAYCVSCGTKLPDGAKYCINCGVQQPVMPVAQPRPVEPRPNVAVPPQPAPQQYAQQQYAAPQFQYAQPQYFAPQPKQSRVGLIVGICSGAAAIAIVLFVLFTSIINFSGERTYSDALRKYTNIIAYGGGEKLVDLMHPDYVNYIIGEGYCTSRSGLARELRQETAESVADFRDTYGADYRIEFRATDTYVYDRIDLEYLNDQLVYYYGFRSRATEAVTVYYDVYISGSRTIDYESTYFEAMRVDGRWYIVPDEFGY